MSAAGAAGPLDGIRVLPDREGQLVVDTNGTARSEVVAELVRAGIEETGRQSFAAEVPDGEEAKTAQVAGFLLGVCGQAEIGRQGVKKVVEGDLTDGELAGLREAAEAVRAKQADVADL